MQKNTMDYVNKYNNDYQYFNVEEYVLVLFIETLLIENDYYDSLVWYANKNNISLHQMAWDIKRIFQDLDFNTNIYKLMDNLEMVLENKNGNFEIDTDKYDLDMVYSEIGAYWWD